MNRQEFAERCVRASRTQQAIAIQAFTGAGKSKVACDIIKDYYENVDVSKKVNEFSVLILVPQDAHKANWRTELAKWDIHWSRTKLVCYASLKKWTHIDWDIIILDEAHHAASPTCIRQLKKLSYKKALLMSATIDQWQIESIQSSLRTTAYVIPYTLDDGIKNGVVPEPTIYKIPLTWNQIKATCVVPLKKARVKTNSIDVQCKWEDRFTYMKKCSPHMNLYAICTPEQKYQYLCDMIDRAKTSRKENMMKNFGSVRKAFVANMKTQAAQLLVEKLRLDKRRFLTFCGSLEQADKLGKDHAVHSRMLCNDETVKKFNNGIIHELFVKNMLRECVSLNNIECGLVIQVDSKVNNFIQECGRLLRSKKPEIFLPYIVGTMDEKWVNDACSCVDQKYVKTVQLSEICRR